MLPADEDQCLEQLWREVQLILQQQMTRTAYENNLQGTKLLVVREDTCCIQVSTSTAQEWLEGRLKARVSNALTSVLGREVEVEFVLAPSPALPEEDDSVSTPGLPEPLAVPTPPVETGQPALSPSARFAQEVDFQSLWFKKGHSSGYTQIPDYVFQFWMLYLNRVKPKAFDLWCRILSDDKRNINDPSFTHWTPVRKYSLRALARTVGTQSLITVAGGPRSCWLNEQTKHASGAPLEGCCGRYQQTKWHQTANGTIRCLHWQKGLLEMLYEEGLLAIAIVKPPPGKPRSHELRLQAWRNLPLLTPAQVSKLNELDQLRHAQWLERYGHHQGIDLARWEGLTDADSLVPFLPDYALQPSSCPTCQNGCGAGCACRCHHSRQLSEAYKPSQDLFGGREG